MGNRTLILFFALLLVACSGNKVNPQQAGAKEDRKAKELLQGIWVNDDEQDVAFRAKGDSIFYPDATSQPVRFQIFGDTLVLHGANDVKYPILKQAPHLFEFRNQNGDIVKLTKSENKDDIYLFTSHQPVVLNQNTLIKRDTIVYLNEKKYHCYVQVNPTKYKVVKATYNDEGVEVDNVYYDNIIHLSIFQGARKVFSRDFRKDMFTGFVPKGFLEQSILSDLTMLRAEPGAITYQAILALPDSPSSFIVDVTIGEGGKMNMKVNK